jgi:hypothetical protein
MMKIINKPLNEFNNVLHNNAAGKKHRRWSIFRPYTYRGEVSRILKISDHESKPATIQFTNKDRRKPTEPVQARGYSNRKNKTI